MLNTCATDSGPAPCHGSMIVSMYGSSNLHTSTPQKSKRVQKFCTCTNKHMNQTEWCLVPLIQQLLRCSRFISTQHTTTWAQNMRARRWVSKSNFHTVVNKILRTTSDVWRIGEVIRYLPYKDALPDFLSCDFRSLHHIPFRPKWHWKLSGEKLPSKHSNCTRLGK